MAESGHGIVDSPGLSAQASLGFLFGPSSGGATSLTEEDRKVSRKVWNELYIPAKEHKAEAGAEKWGTWWDLWRGKHWKKRRPRSLSMAVINEIYSAAETFIGSFAEDLPESIVLPRNPSMRETAQMVTKLLNWTHDVNGFDTEIELPTRSAFVTGFGVQRVDWDTRMDFRRGAPRMHFVDENFFFAAPHAKRLEDAEYILEAKNVPISYVWATWERGREVPPGVWDGSLSPVYGPFSPQGELQDFLLSGTSTSGQSRPGRTEQKHKNLCTLMECWIRQDDGMIRYLVLANGIVLEDGPSPYDDETYPYAVYNTIRNKSSIYGHSVIEQLESMQKELNEVHSYMLDQQKYESDSPLVVRRENINEGKVFSNDPGQVFVDQSPSGPGYYMLSKPGANYRWFEIEARLLDRIRSISGGVDVLHGERPAGVTTLGGMEMLRQQANVVVNKMMRHVRAGVREADILAIHRLRQFMKDERIVRVSGLGGKEEYVTVNERGRMGETGEWERKNTIPKDFEADVDFSPVPPGGFQARFERDMALLQAGVIDQQFVLEDLEFDQAQIEELVERQGAAQQAAAQQEMVQKGVVPPPSSEDPDEIASQVMEMMGGR